MPARHCVDFFYLILLGCLKNTDKFSPASAVAHTDWTRLNRTRHPSAKTNSNSNELKLWRTQTLTNFLTLAKTNSNFDELEPEQTQTFFYIAKNGLKFSIASQHSLLDTNKTKWVPTNWHQPPLDMFLGAPCSAPHHLAGSDQSGLFWPGSTNPLIARKNELGLSQKNELEL